MAAESRVGESQALFDAAVAFVLFLLPPMLVGAFLDPPAPTGELLDQELAAKVETGSLVLLPGMVLMIAYGCWRRRALLARFPVGRVLVSYVVFAIVWIPLAMILFPYVLRTMGHEFEAQAPVLYYARAAHDNGIWIVLLVSCGLAPVAEEVFFRGFLFRAIENVSTRFVALLVTSFLFAVVHAPSVMIPVGFLGLFFGYLRLKTGGVGASILAHFVHNAWNVALLL
jgi:membrane protease YdiL (CAAX protease family)